MQQKTQRSGSQLFGYAAASGLTAAAPRCYVSICQRWRNPMHRERNVKIVATLGPASAAPDRIRALFAAGADVFRLNFSHGSHDDHLATDRKSTRLNSSH